jgi:hypothetical protein
MAFAKGILVAFGGMLTLALVLGSRGTARAQAHPTLPACTPNDPNLLLPDLVPEQPTQLRSMYNAQGRVISFTSTVDNIGDGPLLLEGHTVSTAAGTKTQAFQIIRKKNGSECARLAGYFVFHPAHFHWHFERFVGYELREGSETGRLVAGGQKTTFCLIDVGMVHGYGPVQFPQQTVGNNCGPNGRQGISVGWKDVYLHNYADQFVRLDIDVPYGPVPTGAYILVNHVDPDGILWEKDTTNNVAFTGAGVTDPPPSGGEIVPPTPTPRGVKPPNIRPPRERPTRAPRPVYEITPRERPTRESRPTRPPRGGTTDPEPTATPRPGDTPSVPVGPGGTCQSDCRYSVSQVRMTWYDATGLNLSALITPATCAPLTPEQGEGVDVHLYDWLQWDHTNTGIDVDQTFVLGRDGTGAQTSDGSVSFSALGDSMRIGFTVAASAAARADDGDNFPVVFQACITVGNQQVPMRLVCQPKATGMLCHQ